MIKPGLVSITFRDLKPDAIIALVVEAGLQGIEWGGDIHVPHGNLETARLVARGTRDAGLAVCAYGSYYRAAESETTGLPFAEVLATAAELGAPTVRVWAGRKASSDADAGYRRRVVSDLRRIAAMAETARISLSLEYHANTLTDTNASAQQLVGEVSHPNLRLYWQPPNRMQPDYCLAGLKAIKGVLTNVHVFHWVFPGEAKTVCPLEDGDPVWLTYLSAIGDSPGVHWALLEFVRGGSREHFLSDAATLKGWLTRIEPT